MTTSELTAAAQVSKAWPFEEARKLVKRYPQGKPAKDGQTRAMLFETGYGPSGLPHIGTFQEVLRTTLVRRAYETLTGAPTRLVAFSDDMDGLRKVPDNIPNQGLLTAHIGHPLSRIPDPFGQYESFAHHNNAMLRAFLDRFGFDYEFVSASDQYNSGGFDEALKNVLRNFDAIMGVMLPTLREERRRTYSPVLPISPTTQQVLQVPVAGRRCRGRDCPLPRSWRGYRALHPWRPCQAAVEGRLGDALGRAGCRLRDVRQGSDRFGAGKRQDRADSRRAAARGADLRAVSRRERREDFQVQGQRPDHRPVADLWQRGEPRLLPVPRAQERQAVACRRGAARGGRILAVSRETGAAAHRAAIGQSGVAFAAGEWRWIGGGRGATSSPLLMGFC